MPRALVCVDYLLKNKNLSETQYTKIFIIQQILKSMNEISLLAQNTPVLSTIGIDNRRQKNVYLRLERWLSSLRTLAALLEDQSFITSTHVATHNPL